MHMTPFQIRVEAANEYIQHRLSLRIQKALALRDEAIAAAEQQVLLAVIESLDGSPWTPPEVPKVSGPWRTDPAAWAIRRQAKKQAAATRNALADFVLGEDA